jgi:hypothetical protein
MKARIFHRSIVAGLAIVLAVVACTFLTRKSVAAPVSVEAPAGIDHTAWDRLLKTYVNERGLVAYAKWKASSADLRALDAYLEQFEPAPRPPAAGDEKAAALINLYNALTMRWVLQNYPTDSIRALDDSFGKQRHLVGGRKVSLDDIEHGTLRPQTGYRVHAALVCAARSCPPLQRSAFTGPKLDTQLDFAFREWLAREDLNQFDPQRRSAKISSIFKWFAEDFEKAGGVKKILARHGPKAASGDEEISHLPYHWGLNDQGGKGADYTRGKMLRDNVTNFFR